MRTAEFLWAWSLANLHHRQGIYNLADTISSLMLSLPLALHEGLCSVPLWLSLLAGSWPLPQASVYQSFLCAALPYLFKKQFLIFSPVFYSLSQGLSDLFGWWWGLCPWQGSRVKSFWHPDCDIWNRHTRGEPKLQFSLAGCLVLKDQTKKPGKIYLPWRWEHTQVGAGGKTQPLPPPSARGHQRRSGSKTPWRTLEEKLRRLAGYLQKAPRAKGQTLLWEEVCVPGPSIGAHWGNFKKQP